MQFSIEQEIERYVRGGDLAALGRVFDQLAPDLLRVARRLAPGTGESPEDLVQLTFVTLIEKARELSAQGSLAGWMAGTLALHAKNARRKRTRRAQQPFDAVLEAQLEDSMDSPAASVAVEEWISKVRGAVERTPLRYRPVLSAVLFDDCTPAQAALRLDIAPGTVRQRLRRGLQLLRDGLARSATGALALLSFSGRRARAQRATLLERAARKHPLCSPRGFAQLTSSGPGPLVFAAAGAAALVLLGVLTWIASSPSKPIATLDPLGGATGATQFSQPISTNEHAAPGETASNQHRKALGALPANAPQARDSWIVHLHVGVEGNSNSIPAAQVRVRGPGGDLALVGETNDKGRLTFDVQRRAPDGIERTAAREDLPTFEVLAPGYQRYRVPRGQVRRASFMRTESITVRGDDVHFLIRLMPAFHITGQVLDEFGAPAQAELFLLGPHGDVDGEAALGSTDNNGAFDLNEVGRFFYRSPRPLALVAVGPGGTGFVRVGTDLPQGLSPGESPPVLTGIRITLGGSPLTVRVTDAAGQALAGVLVEAKPVNNLWNNPSPEPGDGRALWLGQLPGTFAARFQAHTDVHGEARFDALPHFDSPTSPSFNGRSVPRWQIMASLAGYVSASAFEHLGLVQTLGMQTAEPLTIPLKRAVQLEVRGLVLGPDGVPMAGVRISNPFSSRETRSDAKGAWSWPVHDPDSLPLELHCWAREYAGLHWKVEALAFGSASVLRYDFQFETPVGFSIRLIDGQGHPVRNVLVAARRVGPDGEGGLQLGRRRSQESGWVRCPAAPAGTYAITLGPALFEDGPAVEPAKLSIQAGEERVISVIVREQNTEDA